MSEIIFDKEEPKIHLGLCCINTELRALKQPIFCSRSLIRRTFTVEKAKQLAVQNVRDIVPIIKWNINNGIDHLRLSSDMFPHYTDLETESYTMDFCDKELKKVGEYANLVGHRITMHPGQYNQVGAKSSAIFEKTVSDLSAHAELLDRMGISDEGILCIHGGGLYGDKESAIRRWIEQFDDLPSSVKRRIAIENCEKCYSVRNCLDIAQATNIPVILDSHHYNCYKELHPDELIEDMDEMMDEIVETWDKSNRRPVFHISDQAPSKRIGAHSDFIENIPSYMLELPEKYQRDLFIEVEAKMKEQAIMKLKNKYKL